MLWAGSDPMPRAKETTPKSTARRRASGVLNGFSRPTKPSMAGGHDTFVAGHAFGLRPRLSLGMRPALPGLMLRTLFLPPPAWEGFDGGAGSRYQARREVRSFWSPTWLAQPAALVPGSRLVDAPPDGLTLQDVLPLARQYDLCVMHTSTPSFRSDVMVAEALRAENPALVIGMVGAAVAVNPEAALRASGAVTFVARSEFDFTIQQVAEGGPLGGIPAGGAGGGG